MKPQPPSTLHVNTPTLTPAASAGTAASQDPRTAMPIVTPILVDIVQASLPITKRGGRAHDVGRPDPNQNASGSAAFPPQMVNLQPERELSQQPGLGVRLGPGVIGPEGPDMAF